MKIASAASLSLLSLLLISGSSISSQSPGEIPAVLVGAGDIADCADLSGAEATAKLIEQTPGTVMAIGDLAYPDGSKENFTCYDKTWGRFKARTRPAVGNHEFHSAGATFYFEYFGAVAGDPKDGFYSYELGALFSSGATHGNDPELRPLWQALYDGNVDVVVGGHDHDYERFAPQTPDAVLDVKRAIREFVAGTGGNSQRLWAAPQPNSEVRNNDAFGVLKFTLRSKGYDWQFIPEAGKSFTDSGSDVCH